MCYEGFSFLDFGKEKAEVDSVQCNVTMTYNA